MNAVAKIRSRINKKVRFKYPEGERVGILLDRAVVPAGKNPHGVRYWHVVDLIKFDDRREPWVRIGYYRQPRGRLVFAGQTTASYRLSAWKRLLARAGKEKPWFAELLRESVAALDSD